MSNAFIPDRLHHMSRSELLAFAQTAHEENVKLCQKLAKANERVKELEQESLAFRSILDQSNRFHPNTDKIYSSGFKDAMRLFEDIYLGGAQQALNKFAIRQKIEAFNEWLYEVKYMEGVSARDLVDSAVKFSEQLRKEQENV
ncbi:hypothetical protein JC525_09205 [Alteromonas sp. IB21]|uniref:hypothetical protein n=1 Tax=Alteromonas sp. IB21 TaxID=2779369 RepID=UPI0018E7739E|nr:hypothetical protein [Alteromonas sp. IB21]MBJ2129114.1 hypothetical protein [Alteromonas sp. IB21]